MKCGARKVNVVSLWTPWKRTGRRGISTLNLGTGWRWGFNFTFRPFYPREGRRFTHWL